MKKKVNHIRSIAGILMVLFLFTSIVAGYLNTLQRHADARALMIDKKSANHSRTDAQLGYEEKEKEKEEENSASHSHRFLIGPVDQPLLSTLAACQAFCVYHAPRCCGNATDVPIYLATRSILI